MEAQRSFTPPEKLLKRLAAATSAGLATTALVACSSTEQSPDSAPSIVQSSPTPEATLSTLEPSTPSAADTKFCNNTLEKILPKNKGTVVVDTRCDGAPDRPIGVYSEPNQDSRPLAHARTGAVLIAQCFQKGESNQNLAEEPYGIDKKTRWIRVTLGRSLPDGVTLYPKAAVEPTGYIPSAWVHGADAITEEC